MQLLPDPSPHSSMLPSNAGDILGAANEVWEAYDMGHQDGVVQGRKDAMAELDSKQRISREKLIQNVYQVAAISEKVRERVRAKLGLNLDGAVRMRIDDPANFNLLFEVAPEVFENDLFTQVFAISLEIKDANKSDTFDIDFTFVPYNEYLDETTIIADGFTYRYKKEGKD